MSLTIGDVSGGGVWDAVDFSLVLLNRDTVLQVVDLDLNHPFLLA